MSGSGVVVPKVLTRVTVKRGRTAGGRGQVRFKIGDQNVSRRED